MNKKLVVIVASALFFATPLVALAQSDTNGGGIAAEIAALQQLVVILTQELEILIAQHQQNAAPTSTTQSTVANSNASTSGTPEYSSYTPVSMALYADDVSAYLGQGVVVTGLVNTFMPEGGTGGTNNYIQIINPFEESQPKMQLEVDDQSSYSAAVDSLQNTSNPITQFIRAYGVGVPDQEFTETSLFGSNDVMVPVVNVTRVDQCIHGSMHTTILIGTSFDDNFFCTTWETIAPSSEAGTVYTTSAPTPTTSVLPSPTTTSSDEPTCTLTASPSSISSGQSSELLWNSTNATAGSISGIGSLSSVNGTMAVSPTASTNYTATFSGSAGSADCSATVSVTQPSTQTQTQSTSVTLSLSNPSVAYDGSPQAAIITSSIPGNIVSVEYNGSANAPTTPGTYPVTALFAPSTDPNNYSARISVGNLVINAGSASIAPDDQAISFGASNNDVLQNVTYGIVGFTVDAQASSGLGVSFTAQGDCTVSNDGTTIATGLGTGSVLIAGVGSCTVTASQPGNEYYNPAPDVSQTFTIASSTSSQ